MQVSLNGYSIKNINNLQSLVRPQIYMSHS